MSVSVSFLLACVFVCVCVRSCGEVGEWLVEAMKHQMDVMRVKT